MKLLIKFTFLSIAFVATVSSLLAASPTITSASANANNTVINVTGTNFVAQDAKHPLIANLDNMPLTITASTPTSLTANLPANLTPGSYHLFISTTGNLDDKGHTAQLDVTVTTSSSAAGPPPIIPVISMVWSSSVTPISQPADGQIGCNNSDPTSCTQIWSSLKGTDGIDYSSLFNAFSADNGGYLVIRNISSGNGTPQNILVFPLSTFGYSFSRANNNQTMNCSPATIYLGAFFSDGDQLIVSFLPPPVQPN